MNKKETASLLVSGLAITGGVVASIIVGDASGTTGLIVKESLSALGGLGTEVSGSLIDKYFLNKNPRAEILNNSDLTRAVGKAIFELFRQESNSTTESDDKKSLQIISNTKIEIWKAITIGGGYEEGYGLSLSNLNIDEISPNKSTQYLKAKEGKLDEVTTLTSIEWKTIVEKLKEKNNCILSDGAITQISYKLHLEFAKTLLSILIDDFVKDGRAYASMQFRLLSEIGYYSKQTYEGNEEIKRTLNSFIVRIDQVEALYKSRAIALDVKFWQDAFDLQKDLKEITSETLERVILIQSAIEKQSRQLNRIEEKQKIFIEMNQIQAGSFIPFVVNIEKEVEEMIDRFSQKAKAKLKHFCRLTNHPINESQTIENYYYEITMVKKQIV